MARDYEKVARDMLRVHDAWGALADALENAREHFTDDDKTKLALSSMMGAAVLCDVRDRHKAEKNAYEAGLAAAKEPSTPTSVLDAIRMPE